MQLDIFIEGETIDLCIPTLEFAQSSDWYSWFNHPHTTQFLEHRVFPNTKEKQVDFFLKEKDKRLMLIIQDKSHQAIGTISLSCINQAKKQADLGIVMDTINNINPLASLEAVAKITEHGFKMLGLKRILVGHHINLIPWSHLLSLLGYRLDGIIKNGFIKGTEIKDALIGAAHYEDYQTIISHRGGGLWDSQKNMLQRIRSLPKTPIHKKLQEFFAQYQNYYMDIFKL